ncbi:hypothetical protein [Streptomyces sp. NPDC002588]|uniref:hypothetical protein n=1 Tax=Streptomyces sp. NPDC002588 TaxID=3154419 RepID=UPI00332D2F22
MEVTVLLSRELPDRFELLALVEPEVEEDRDERGFEAVHEEVIRTMRRETRIGLARGTVQSLGTGEPGRRGYDIPLICVVQTHPECTVRWSRLVLDLSVTAGARVEDMAPILVEGQEPVEIETTLGVGLSFDTVVAGLGAELTPQVTRRRTVYCPRITSSGIGFPAACWDFRASDQEFLHVNEELRLLASAPDGAPLKARVTLRARVVPRGFARVVGLTGKLGVLDVVSLLA